MAEEIPKRAEDGQLVPSLPVTFTDGRDEMNFAEFPLGTLSKRADPGVKTLIFEDTIRDKSSGESVKRKLTIMGSDLLGLPTSTDDEVLLALIQLTKLQGFFNRTVYFTRYQLIRLLGWDPGGQSYERVQQSLNRWLAITLIYDNAWRDRGSGTWADEGFHVIDRVKIDSGENERTRPKPDPSQSAFEFASSSFTWNEVVFRSFASGNLKSLDYSVLQALKSSVSKRLYRFLDKRLHRISRLEFDLKTLAYEKLGASRNAKVNELKRMVSQAMEELIECEFLRRTTPKERFKKIGVGNYRVIFERARIDAREVETKPEQPELPLNEKAKPELSPIEQALTEAGIKGSKVYELAANFPAELITEKLELLALLMAKQSKQVADNPAGFLIRSIEENYENPLGFVSSAQKLRTAESERARVAKAKTNKKKQETAAGQKQRILDELVDGYWNSLTEAERKKQEDIALSKASDFERQMLNDGGEYMARIVLFAKHAKAKLRDQGVTLTE